MRTLPEKIRVSARVRLTVEIDVSDAWGGDCALSQVYRQAVDSVIKNRLHVMDRIIGEPEVSAIIVTAGGI